MTSSPRRLRSPSAPQGAPGRRHRSPFSADGTPPVPSQWPGEGWASPGPGGKCRPRRPCQNHRRACEVQLLGRPGSELLAPPGRSLQVSRCCWAAGGGPHLRASSQCGSFRTEHVTPFAMMNPQGARSSAFSARFGARRCARLGCWELRHLAPTREAADIPTRQSKEREDLGSMAFTSARTAHLQTCEIDKLFLLV